MARWTFGFFTPLVAFPVLFAALWSACAAPARFASTEPNTACSEARAGTGAFAGADLGRGQAVFEDECAECHGVTGTEKKPKGPSLHGVVGRRVGGVEGFRYSEAFQDRSDRWTLDALDRYLEDPDWYYPETRMRFSGLMDPGDRKNLLAMMACETR